MCANAEKLGSPFEMERVRVPHFNTTELHVGSSVQVYRAFTYNILNPNARKITAVAVRYASWL